MLLGELGEFLGAHGFIRVALEMTSSGWRDVLFLRKEFA
jgi:hypothetical protein